MRKPSRFRLAWIPIAVVFALLIASAADSQHQHEKRDSPKASAVGRAPESLPRVPVPDASAAQVPSGYRVEIVASGLTYPTSIEFDDSGAIYVAESGFNYGDDMTHARILR